MLAVANAVRTGSIIRRTDLTLPHTRSAPPEPRLESLERQAIEAAIAEEAGNVSAAAAKLGISRATMYRRLNRYRLLER